MMGSVFFLRLSGENEALAEAEVRAILDSEEIEYKILERLPQVLILSSTSDSLETLSERCSLTREGGSLLFMCRVQLRDIHNKMLKIDESRLGLRGESFSVRIRRIQGSSREIEREDLEREIGRLILMRRSDLRVDLQKPTNLFLGLLTGEKLVFGLKHIEVKRRDFRSRKPRKRPFFHPTSMSPILARAIVNLARCRRGEIILDPFCGTGSILLEAGMMDRKVIGSDAKADMVSGTLKNLRQWGIDPEGLVVSESGYLPFREVKSIATDTPYGKLSTTLGEDPKSVLEGFFKSAAKIVPKGRHICVGSRSNTDLNILARDKGFIVVERIPVREHRSLTRIISVLRKE